jgi:uncharacterized protein YraI
MAVVVILAAAIGITGWRASPIEAARGATVATDALNVRSEPGTWAAVLDTLVWGEWVEILDGPTWDNWYYVGHWDGVGWVFGDYLAFDGVGGNTGNNLWIDGNAGLSVPVWVTTDALNVRAGPSGSAAVVDLVTYGQGLTVVGYAVDGFVPISHWNGAAWVWEGYLSYSVPAGPERWIDVDRSSQRVNLMEGGVVVASFWGAMGWDQSNDGYYATANGTYYVFEKVRGLSWTPFGGIWMRFWVEFDSYRRNGFHTFSMDEYGNVLPSGANPTGGCVALEPWAAEYLFDFVDYGTRVEIHW